MDRCPSKVSLPATAALSASSAAPLRAASDLESDRKSTRLNSSHITISYAVFCLKKKKQSFSAAGLMSLRRWPKRLYGGRVVRPRSLPLSPTDAHRQSGGPDGAGSTSPLVVHSSG